MHKAFIDETSQYVIKANISHNSNLYITNIDNTSDRERITSTLSITIHDNQSSCQIYDFNQTISQFYIFATSDLFLSNKKAVNEIKKNNTDELVKDFLKNLTAQVLFVMPRINNISLIKSFLSSAENHLIINQVNEDIGLFYIYVIQFLALNQKLSVHVSEEQNHKNSSDLFGEIKIPIIKTTSTNKIKDILSSNQKNIVITDYKNYKKFTGQVTLINGYDHARDIKFFIKENLQIENGHLLELLY